MRTEDLYQTEGAFLKGTVASVWVWLKVVWMETAKIGEDSLRVFKNFPLLLRF
jgi:hypothetical protein